MVDVYIFIGMHLDINNTFRIDFDPFRMILTLISFAIAYISYSYHPQQAWGLMGMWGSWVGKTKYYDLR